MTLDKDVLADLLGRVERATGPDRSIDLAFARMFDELGHASGLPDSAFLGDCAPPCGFSRRTHSIDAAVRLVEKVLPGRSVTMGYGQTAATRPWCRIGGVPYVSDPACASLPLAILAALLTALRALSLPTTAMQEGGDA